MKWNTAWSYLPIDYGTSIGTVENITQRSYFTNNVSGTKVKLRFANRYGNQELVFERVVIGQIKPGKQQIDEIKKVTYQGQERIQIPVGQEFYSDELEWNIEANTEIVVSIYIKEKMNVQSACQTWLAKSWRTRYGLCGDYTLEQKFEEVECRTVYPYVEADPNKSNVIVGISEILIEGEKNVKNVTMFGDSITHMSYYSDALAYELYEAYPGQVTVVNRGIGGNRLLHNASYLPQNDGHGRCFGIAGNKRYMKDIFENNTPDTVLILEGVNDIMHPHQFQHNKDEVVSAEDLISCVKEMIDVIHEHAAKVYLGTIMPFKLEQVDWLELAEDTRNQYNEWVRTQNITDGILDFDQALRDEKEKDRLEDGTHIGDGLHPNITGGKRMASLVPVKEIMEG